MSFYAYVVKWDAVHYNVVEMEDAFKAYGQEYTVINSGNMTRDGWHDVGDIRYYRQLYYALMNFDYNYDYMAFICGDVSHWNWAGVLDRAKSVLDSYEPGLYAPHLTNEPWKQESSCIGQVPIDEKLLISIQTDGIMVFIHRDIASVLLEYFEYLEKQIDIKSITSGWGMDMIWSSIAIANNQLILRDNAYIVEHPAGSSYDHSKASSDLKIVLDNFYGFLEHKGIDPSAAREIHSKIYGRMSQDPNCMAIQDFYSDVPKLYKHYNTINYHTIYINDERKSNRDLIDRMLNANKVNIKSLSVKDGGLEEFKKDNPEFKFAWDGFKPGEIGNFGSHYNAWKYLKNSDLNSLLVFEDDTFIHQDFVEKYNVLIKNVPQDYDILSVYVDPNQYERFDSSQYISYYIAKGYQDWSTLCYVISKQGAEKLCKYVEEIGFDHPTDWFIFRKGHQGIFNVYTTPPYFPSPLEIDQRYESQVQ